MSTWKSKSRHKAYTTNFTNRNIEMDFACRTIKLPKAGKVKAKLHREFSGTIKSATISQAPSGKYFVSVLVETEHIELVHTTSHVGLDLGIKDLCITSGGIKYERELAKLQRPLAHKQKGSRNYKKQKRKIARCHEKIHNIRKNHLHQVTQEIISENQVVVEWADLYQGGYILCKQPNMFLLWLS